MPAKAREKLSDLKACRKKLDIAGDRTYEVKKCANKLADAILA